MREVISAQLLRQTAIKAAKEAGKIIKAGFGKHHKAKLKGITDIVTSLDKKTQDAIIRIIKKKFPEHAFLSEETPRIQGKSDYLWIIDPLDGTANYNSRIPFFCTSICLAYKHEPIIGVVFDPLRNEMFVAEKNRGAFLNNKRVTVSKEKGLNKVILIP